MGVRELCNNIEPSKEYIMLQQAGRGSYCRINDTIGVVLSSGLGARRTWRRMHDPAPAYAFLKGPPKGLRH